MKRNYKVKKSYYELKEFDNIGSQKSNIKDASGVTGSFSALQSGDIDAKSFRKQLKTGNDPLTDEQIDNLFAFLANL